MCVYFQSISSPKQRQPPSHLASAESPLHLRKHFMYTPFQLYFHSFKPAKSSKIDFKQRLSGSLPWWDVNPSYETFSLTSLLLSWIFNQVQKYDMSTWQENTNKQLIKRLHAWETAILATEILSDLGLSWANEVVKHRSTSHCSGL